MKLTIKKADISDLDDILALNFLLFQSDHRFDKTLNMSWTHSKKGRKYFMKRLKSKNEIVFTALTNGKTVGYIAGLLQKNQYYRIKGNYAELANMYVLEKYRSYGIGTKLVDKFLSWCRTKRVDYVTISASFNNNLGINFYKKNGFSEQDIILKQKIA